MFGFSKRLFRSNNALSESIFSEEFLEPIAHAHESESGSDSEYEYDYESGYEYPSESSDSWATLPSHAEEFFSTLSSSGSIHKSDETRSCHNTLEEGLQDIAEDDGEARLARIVSWVAKGYSSLYIPAGTWTLEDQEEPGMDGNRDVGQRHLEEWRKVIDAKRRQREREVKREQWRKRWMAIKLSMSPGSSEPVSPPSTRNEIRRSCVSDKDKVKKGNKFFRARRRIANVFRRVERPVESRIAQERFVIE